MKNTPLIKKLLKKETMKKNINEKDFQKTLFDVLDKLKTKENIFIIAGDSYGKGEVKINRVGFVTGEIGSLINLFVSLMEYDDDMFFMIKMAVMSYDLSRQNENKN